MTRDQQSVRFSFSEGKLALAAKSAEVGEANVEMDIEYEGGPAEVAFNPQFLLDGLSVTEVEGFLRVPQSEQPGQAHRRPGLHVRGDADLPRVTMSDTRGGIPERVGDILARAMREAGLRKPSGGPDLDSVWREVAGEDVAANSRVASIRRGVLTIDVFSAPLRQELEIYRRDELLRALRDRLGGAGPERLAFRLA